LLSPYLDTESVRSAHIAGLISPLIHPSHITSLSSKTGKTPIHDIYTKDGQHGFDSLLNEVKTKASRHHAIPCKKIRDCSFANGQQICKSKTKFFKKILIGTIIIGIPDSDILKCKLISLYRFGTPDVIVLAELNNCEYNESDEAATKSFNLLFRELHLHPVFVKIGNKETNCTRQFNKQIDWTNDILLFYEIYIKNMIMSSKDLIDLTAINSINLIPHRDNTFNLLQFVSLKTITYFMINTTFLVCNLHKEHKQIPILAFVEANEASNLQFFVNSESVSLESFFLGSHKLLLTKYTDEKINVKVYIEVRLLVNDLTFKDKFMQVEYENVIKQSLIFAQLLESFEK
jgi:hypothetical protein